MQTYIKYAKWIIAAVLVLWIMLVFRFPRYEVIDGGNYGVYLYDKFNGRTWRLLIEDNTIRGWKLMENGPYRGK